MKNKSTKAADWTRSTNSLELLSQREGFERSYLSVVRLDNKEKFDRIFGFHENPSSSVNMYKDFVMETNQKAIDIYFSFSDRKELKKFLLDSGAYRHIASFESSIFFFIDKEISVNYSQIKRWESLIIFWEENYGD